MKLIGSTHLIMLQDYRKKTASKKDQFIEIIDHFLTPVTRPAGSDVRFVYEN